MVESGKRDIGTMSYAAVVRIARVLSPATRVEELFPIPPLPEPLPDTPAATEQPA